MSTKYSRWPASGNSARLESMTDLERIAQIARELLQHHDVKADADLKALAFEVQALAERSRRKLGEARPV